MGQRHDDCDDYVDTKSGACFFRNDDGFRRVKDPATGKSSYAAPPFKNRDKYFLHMPSSSAPFKLGRKK